MRQLALALAVILACSSAGFAWDRDDDSRDPNWRTEIPDSHWREWRDEDDAQHDGFYDRNGDFRSRDDR